MTFHEEKFGGAVLVSIVKYLEITQAVVHKGSTYPKVTFFVALKLIRHTSRD